MRSTQQFSITLPSEMAQLVKSKVASGEYATESEVIRDGLRALAARDKAVEKWLHDEVLPTLQDAQANPDSLRSPEDVRHRLKAQARNLAGRPPRDA